MGGRSTYYTASFKRTASRRRKLDALPADLIDSETVVMDHRVRYYRAGAGPAVVLVHGGASDRRDWLGTLAALAGRFTCYAPDLVGFGETERRPDGYYLTEFITFLEQFIETLGLGRPSLVGHSFGGRLVLGVAVGRPDLVDKLVLVDAAGLGKTSKLGLVLVAAYDRLHRLLHRPSPHPDFLAHEDDDPDWACVGDLPKVNAPTLIVWKRRDPYLPLANAVQAARLIPRAKLQIVPGTGHAPHKSDTDAFNRLVGDFLKDGGGS
jgi:pimeloyl-ACP methyl ester carboxylesterase